MCKDVFFPRSVTITTKLSKGGMGCRKKSVFVCVKRDLTHPVSFALREFEGKLNVRYFDNTKQLGAGAGEVLQRAARLFSTR